jgi:mannose-6-phosphate isomerase-like protein (cupin superfamily)
MWLGDKEYDAKPGALVFIPAETSISLRNTGKENILFCWQPPKGARGNDCVVSGRTRIGVGWITLYRIQPGGL